KGSSAASPLCRNVNTGAAGRVAARSFSTSTIEAQLSIGLASGSAPEYGFASANTARSGEETERTRVPHERVDGDVDLGARVTRRHDEPETRRAAPDHGCGDALRQDRIARQPRRKDIERGAVGHTKREDRALP